MKKASLSDVSAFFHFPICWCVGGVGGWYREGQSCLNGTNRHELYGPGCLEVCAYTYIHRKGKKNQCPREGMFRGSFARARGRDEG